MIYFRNLLLHAEWVTGRRPDIDPVAIHLGNRDVRLHRVVIDHRKLESVLEDLVGLGKAAFHVTFDKLGLEANIFLGKFVNRSEERRVGKECRSRWSRER